MTKQPCINCGSDTGDGGDALCDECLTVELDGLGDYTTPADEPAPFLLTTRGLQAVAWLYQHDADARAFAKFLKAARQ
jgi:hypothetical protein